MSGNLPPPPTADFPEDGEPRHPNFRKARALLTNGRYEPVSATRMGSAVVVGRRGSNDLDVASHWLGRSAALGRDSLQIAVSSGLVAVGQPGLAFQLLALPISVGRNGRPVVGLTERAAAIDVLARLAREHLSIDDAEPRLDQPQAVLDGAQAALWLLRTDKRHWAAAQRLLLSRTVAVRQQVASGARELCYADLPTPGSVGRALDRSVTWLRLLSLGDLAALGLAPEAPEQPLPPGFEGEELA